MPQLAACFLCNKSKDLAVNWQLIQMSTHITNLREVTSWRDWIFTSTFNLSPPITANCTWFKGNINRIIQNDLHPLKVGKCKYDGFLALS